MIPDWVLTLIFGAVIAAVGWLIAFLFGRLNEVKKANTDASQKNFDELKCLVMGILDKLGSLVNRVTGLEKDCVKHEEIESIVAPMAKKIQELEKNQSVQATQCRMRHSKDK